MGQNTNIEWTDHTFNAWIGCTKVSPGCANCYAATQDNFRKWTPAGWGKGKPRKRTSESNWKEPLKWNGIASAMHKEAAFFMKQMGGSRKPFPAIPDDLMIRQFPACPVCHGLSMLPGTEPNHDVMNTPCPQCNEWFAMSEGQKGGETDFFWLAMFWLISSYFTKKQEQNPNKFNCLTLPAQPSFYHGRILDPACGSGGMFIQSARFVEASAVKGGTEP